MERAAERQRADREVVVDDKGLVEKQWEEAEVLALISVWDEVGAQHVSESRSTYELISERLRRLSIVRKWWECQAQCRSLGLQSRKCDAAATKYSPGGGEEEEDRLEEGWEEDEDEGTQRGSYPSSVSNPTEAGHRTQIHRPSPYNPSVTEEGGRHWTDDEVRALLCVWADRRVRERLKSTLRNKCIFQEMSYQMQRNFGVVRNWKQCRTKYKNLKYDYKTAKSAHAAAENGSGGPGKYMKFFDEVDAILLDRGLEDGMVEMQKRLYDGELVPQRLPTPGSESEVVIEIDDDHPDHFHVVTVPDAGRNWSEQEVRALVQVWSDERVCRQLESSTRKRDIFVQISNRLMQQGIDRDWKQCHTKYKNLKYLYRSLQRGMTEETDPRKIMRFYNEVDAIMNRTRNGSSRNAPAANNKDSERHSMSENCEDNENIDVNPTKINSDSTTASEMEEKTCSSDSVSSEGPNVPANNKQKRIQPVLGERTDLRHELKSPSENSEEPEKKTVSPSRRKRKSTDQDSAVEIASKKLNSHSGSADNMGVQCKEEEDHIPIIKINSVRSMASPDQSPDRQSCESLNNSTMEAPQELKTGQKLNEGKTKQIFELVDEPGLVLVQSKDQITAGNAVRKDQMEGKAAIANKTTSCVFKLLQDSGIKTAFVKQHSDTAFIAAHCEMIPIEWVCRRVATGSFLKRNPGVKEGYRFSPLKMEMFFKDDANNDPQWSEEQLLEAKFTLAGLTIGQCEVDIMNRSTVAIFEILEKAWATQNCTLVDMKIEFGVNVKTQEIVLADVIDNDSWRLWPAGDRSQQKDKQVYRDLKEVTPEAMQMVKRNFEWVSERVKLLLEPQASGRVVVLMGSTSDMAHCEKIRKACTSYGIPCILRVTSAHKGPDETLRIKAQYEGDGVPTVFVAVAGRSNGLGPVMSGNTAYPVINCPPLTPDWGAQDVWSSLRMPSGLGCSTILSAEAAAQFAAQIFGLTDHLVWCKLRASMLNTWVSLKLADKKLQACTI
ncbi:uncharacterized protein LOC109991474 [Xyrichtys novacula]|uniref:Uncharacterized protein LOC109991474 n=2 Tax=Xyrichtys novacula TaxID=13765 RepID=A0AAV1FHM9_XYRNO|nr:uncharacterized protein LOC109991474 [Xyrichtys novacula]